VALRLESVDGPDRRIRRNAYTFDGFPRAYAGIDGTWVRRRLHDGRHFGDGRTSSSS